MFGGGQEPEPGSDAKFADVMKGLSRPVGYTNAWPGNIETSAVA